MKKLQKLVLLFCALLVLCCKEKNKKIVLVQAEKTPRAEWKLVWEEDFNTAQLDTTKWSFVSPKKADWNNYMTSDQRCYKIQDGKIHLRGIANLDTIKDKRPFLTGGIYTKGKLEFLYGKIAIRAKMQSAKGSWPALWLVKEHKPKPNTQTKFPPKDYSEIDVLEHLNFDDMIYQTIHSYYTLELKEKENPKYYATTKVDVSQFNTYGIEWFRDKIVFTINDQPTFVYPKLENVDKTQWPFDSPLFIILSQQLGGSWVGEIRPEDLPVELVIDWVRIYQ